VTDTVTLHRRPLPSPAIPFSSEEGRALFRESLESGHLEAFFPLIEQFHTQSDPSFCGLGSLVMVLNALGVDPGRVWRGPWRWFSEELLDCCTPLAKVQVAGLTLDEVACLARCNGAEVELGSVSHRSLADLRVSVERSTRSTTQMLIASYSRAALGQTGSGHFSPIGGYHAGLDLALVLDVARFKYPPHWVPLTVLYEAMRDFDPVSGRPRGWLSLRKRARASAVARFLVCADGVATRGLVEHLLVLQARALGSRALGSVEDVMVASAEAISASEISERVRLRSPETAEQRALFSELEAGVASVPLYRRALARLGPELGGRVFLWWLAAPRATWAALPSALQPELLELLDTSRWPAELAAEAELLSSQIEFLLSTTMNPPTEAAAAVPLPA
jgi:glutathione gamma-glutamylcysteinyltransferase